MAGRLFSRVKPLPAPRRQVNARAFSPTAPIRLTCVAETLEAIELPSRLWQPDGWSVARLVYKRRHPEELFIAVI
jgi:hypothetical protein